jgi:hypothetical protein
MELGAAAHNSVAVAVAVHKISAKFCVFIEKWNM